MQTPIMQRKLLDGGLAGLLTYAGGSLKVKLLLDDVELSGNGYTAQTITAFSAAASQTDGSSIKQSTRVYFGAVGGDLFYNQFSLSNHNGTELLFVSDKFSRERIPQGRTHSIMLAFQAPYLPPSTRIVNPVAGESSFQHVMQAAVFNIANIHRLGLHFSIGGDPTGRLTNRSVWLIDPVNTEAQQAVVEHNPNWSPTATSQPGNFNLEWVDTPPWNQYGIFCRSWSSFVERNVPHLVNWLRPNWTAAAAPSAPYPLVHFQEPHGREFGRMSPSFFAALEAQEEGLTHLVNGYYETLYRLRMQGIFTSTGLGCPDSGGEALRRPPAATDRIKLMLADSLTVLHAIGVETHPNDSKTATTLAEVYAGQQGITIEGLPGDGGGGAPTYWRTGVTYPINVAYADALDEILVEDTGPSAPLPIQAAADFNTIYGNRWFIIRTAPDDFGLFLPAADAIYNVKAAYLTAYADAVASILAAIGNSIVLIDYRVAALAGQLGYAATNFLS